MKTTILTIALTIAVISSYTNVSGSNNGSINSHKVKIINVPDENKESCTSEKAQVNNTTEVAKNSTEELFEEFGGMMLDGVDKSGKYNGNGLSEQSDSQQEEQISASSEASTDKAGGYSWTGPIRKIKK